MLIAHSTNEIGTWTSQTEGDRFISKSNRDLSGAVPNNSSRIDYLLPFDRDTAIMPVAKLHDSRLRRQIASGDTWNAKLRLIRRNSSKFRCIIHCLVTQKGTLNLTNRIVISFVKKIEFRISKWDRTLTASIHIMFCVILWQFRNNSSFWKFSSEKTL